MTAIEHSGEQQANLYNFFEPDLWLARVDGMVWLLRMTYDVIDGTLGGLEGLSVEKCQQLLQEITAKKKEAQTLDLDFHLLEAFLTGLVQKETLPVAVPAPAWAVDFDFEVKQLINLRSLCITYIYFFADMRQLIVEALSTSQTAQGHPPLHLIQACYRQLGNDIELLQNASIQRQPSVDTAGKPVAGVLAKELVMTDKLAIKTLAPFAHLLAHPTIFTFFSQETHIRHLPFSDQVILVGLSHARISITYNEQMRSGAAENGQKPLPAFELLAIPHEIGHYLYDHAQLELPAANNALAKGHFVDLSAQFHGNPYHHWCEELFADLFGCVVAGPLAVLGMQALLAAGEPTSLWQDDGEHPTSVVRPYILAEMLRVLAVQENELAQKANVQNPVRYQFVQAAHSLDANWSATLQRLGFVLVDVKQGRPAQIKLPATAAVMDVDQLVKTVTPISAEFAKHLLAHARFDLGDTAGSDTLSAAMPWVSADQARLQAYTNALVALTGTALAHQKVAQHGLLTLNFWDAKWQSSVQGATAAAKLQHWLDQWGDRGPRTIGGH